MITFHLSSKVIHLALKVFATKLCNELHSLNEKCKFSAVALKAFNKTIDFFTSF
jgi:hypothetical protein